MGFFGKLFKKKKKKGQDEGGPSKNGKPAKGKALLQLQQQPSTSPRTSQSQYKSPKNRSPSSGGVPQQVTAFSPGSRENQYSPRDYEYDDYDAMGIKPKKSTTSPRSPSDGRVLSPRNHSLANKGSSQAPGDKIKYPVVQPGVPQNENLDHSNAHANAIALAQNPALGPSPRLSQHQLQQFDQQQPQRGPIFSMSADIPRGQMVAMDEMSRDSSSFNLSTDAEDSEYENFRRRGVLPVSHANANSTLDSSVLSSASAFTKESDLFPALSDDTSRESRSRRQRPTNQNLLRPLHPSTPEDEPGQIYSNSPPKNSNLSSFQPPTPASIVRMDHESEADLRAWTISPTSVSTRDHPTSTTSGQTPTTSSSPLFTFEQTPSSSRRDNPPSTTASKGTLYFTSPHSQASSSTGFTPDPDFNFADFNAFSGNNPFPSATKSEAWREEKKVPEVTSSSSRTSRTTSSRDYDHHSKDFQFSSSYAREPSSSYAHSSPGSGQDSSLQDLLAQAKNKQRRSSRGGGTRSSRASTSSVNSAPAITASYLRQQHNLGRYSSGLGSTTNNDETSVSDIIQSLEATRTSQLRSSRSGNRSVGDSGAVATARAVKERLRESRRASREYGLKNRYSDLSSSGESDHEASDSWLFDEVTGALGPRGIAADLESLSGRSNRSKTSASGRSHKSHRSTKSRHNRTTRRTKSSGESVDSRGSRTSRYSHNSRYSHRSTKSYLSQMSEQSRSVANDLLRLEMQLAMVGSQDNNNDIPTKIGGGSISGSTSVGGSSRTSRHNRRKSHGQQQRSSSSQKGILATSPAGLQVTRRHKTTVRAPPGKLGIILANKADSKGTVVSGVRTSSVLAEKITPGDRIIAIDGEDVSRMTVSEITTIMGRKAEYDRTLTVLTVGQPSPEKQAQPSYSSNTGLSRARSEGLRSSSSDALEATYSQYRR